MGQAGSSLKGSGELLTSIKRYYSNAFTDRVKQDAINLFLGHFVPIQSKTSLWELESDYHLHNKLLRPHPPFSDDLLLVANRTDFSNEGYDTDSSSDNDGDDGGGEDEEEKHTDSIVIKGQSFIKYQVNRA